MKTQQDRERIGAGAPLVVVDSDDDKAAEFAQGAQQVLVAAVKKVEAADGVDAALLVAVAARLAGLAPARQPLRALDLGGYKLSVQEPAAGATRVGSGNRRSDHRRRQRTGWHTAAA